MKLNYCYEPGKIIVIGNKSRMACLIPNDEGRINEDKKLLMARRLTACYNACEGISLEVLEYPEYSFKDELDTLDEQIRLRMAAENILDNYRLEVEKHLKTIREVLGKTGEK